MDFYGFFNGKWTHTDDEGYDRYDREYDADDLAAFIKAFYLDGIFPYESTAFTVRPLNDMQISVSKGQGHIQGRFFKLNSSETLRIEDPDINFSRIDRIVIRLDKESREVILDVKKGKFSSRPNPPALTRDDLTYELCIAEITVRPGVRKIESRDIKDTRYIQSLCGVVQHALKYLDIKDLRDKYEADLKEFLKDFSKYIDNSEANVDELLRLFIEHLDKHKATSDDKLKEFIEYLSENEKDIAELVIFFQNFVNAKQGDIIQLINDLNDIIAGQNEAGELIALINTKQDKYMKDRVLPTKYEIFFENGKMYYEEVQ